MAFGAEELRVLRRALALAITPGPAPAEDAQACRGLAESVDEAVRESARLRAFLLADLARYRAALPGALSGYLALLQDALEEGYTPVPDDLAALRALRGNPAAAALLARCDPHAPVSIPAARLRLHALPGGRRATRAGAASEGEPSEPKKKPAKKPAPAPEPRPQPKPAPGSKPRRPIPTPGEVFPPRRKPSPSPPPKQRLAVG